MTNHTEITEAMVEAGAGKLDSRNWDDASSEELVRAILTAALQASTSSPAEPSADLLKLIRDAHREGWFDGRHGTLPNSSKAWEVSDTLANLTKGSPNHAG